MRRSARHERRTSLRGLTVSLIVAVFFLGFASVISLLAPIYLLNLRREDGNGVSAEVTQRLLLLIPIRKKTLASVTSARTRSYAPSSYIEPGEPTVVVRPEQQGFLALEGERGSTEIPCSPVDVADAERSVEDFLAGSDSRRRLWFVSNWKFAVLTTGLVAAPGIIIILLTAWDIIAWFVRRRHALV